MYIAFGEAKVDSVAVSRNAAAGTPVQRVCREIQSEFEDVILTTNPLKYNAFRESMKVLFPNEKVIIVSLQNYQTPDNQFVVNTIIHDENKFKTTPNK